MGFKPVVMREKCKVFKADEDYIQDKINEWFKDNNVNIISTNFTINGDSCMVIIFYQDFSVDVD